MRANGASALVIALVAVGCGGKAIHQSTAAHDDVAPLADGGGGPPDADIRLVLPNPNPITNGASLPPNQQPSCEPTAAHQILANDVWAGNQIGLRGSMPQNGGASDSLVVSKYEENNSLVFKLFRVAKDGCSTQVLADRNGYLRAMAAGSSNVYWTETAVDDPNPRIWTVPVHGGTPTPIDIGPYGTPAAIAADEGALYVFAYDTHQVFRLLRLACCGHETEIFTDAPAFDGIHDAGAINLLLDGPNVWIEFVDYTLDRPGPGDLVYVDGNTRGMSMVKLGPPAMSTGNAAVYGGSAYLAPGESIYRLDRLHDPARVVNTSITEMAVDAAGIYWGDRVNHVWESRLDGTGLKQVGTDVTDGGGVAVDVANMYWVNSHKQLVRARK